MTVNSSAYRKVTDDMPKKASNKMAGMPILDFAVDTLKELKGVSIRSSIHDQIGKYRTFVQRTKGQKPDDSAVVEKILETWFARETGFQKFLKDGSTKPAVSAAPSTAGPSATEP